MIKKIAAITAAAACAGVMVAFVPNLVPAVKASTTDQNLPSGATIHSTLDQVRPAAADIRKAVEQNIRNGSRERKIICTQSWPYYENSCLRDDRQTNAAHRVVRVIAANRAAAIRPSR
jgi:hypothetical protein